MTPDYFRALDIPIIRGRGFTDQDRTGDEGEVVLSRSVAALLFPGESPLGKRLQTAGLRTTGLRSNEWFTVVGVADNVKNNGLTEPSVPEMYYLRRSVADDWSDARSIALLRSVMPAKAVEPWVRSAIASIDPTVPVETEILNQTVRRMADRPRFETALLAFFAFTGLMLAVVGLYGLMAFTTAQRTREIGIRMALGATRQNILRLITGDGFRMVAVGGALGLGAALAISRLLKALLFDVSTEDPLTFVVVPLILALVALVAILIPARAGMRVEPAATLRAE